MNEQSARERLFRWIAEASLSGDSDEKLHYNPTNGGCLYSGFVDISVRCYGEADDEMRPETAAMIMLLLKRIERKASNESTPRILGGGIEFKNTYSESVVCIVKRWDGEVITSGEGENKLEAVAECYIRMFAPVKA